MSGNVKNFRKNNTKYAIKIKMTVKGGKLHAPSIPAKG
ncbi:MAG: hypothetical protein ACLR6O_01230 [Eubacterium sp.]